MIFFVSPVISTDIPHEMPRKGRQSVTEDKEHGRLNRDNCKAQHHHHRDCGSEHHSHKESMSSILA
jgi:hypothetical protein